MCVTPNEWMRVEKMLTAAHSRKHIHVKRDRESGFMALFAVAIKWTLNMHSSNPHSLDCKSWIDDDDAGDVGE